MLVVVELSASFGAVWPDLAGELGLALHRATPSAVPHGTLAVVLAAGGEEQAALDALPALGAQPAPVFVVGAVENHRVAVEALRRGAADYFALPNDLDALRRAVARVVETHAARAAATPDDAFASLIGTSAPMVAVLARARRVVTNRDVTVLIGGETGTGKELLAHALHRGGPRASGPFVPLNCAAIPAQLLESELFGHERGAFTDAREAKPGLFEAAEGGTLFLDEIGHLPLALQGKLLRALETREIRRIGATRDRAVDIRIITATHVDLVEAVRRGDFREDLYYRLNVVRLDLPPLRARGEDVILLAQHLLADAAARYGLPEPPLDAATMTIIKGHTWPGNVRELRHALERALLLSAPGSLNPEELVQASRLSTASDAAPAPQAGSLSDVVRSAVRAAVQASDGNKSEAARRLGISRTRLLRILAQEEDA